MDLIRNIADKWKNQSSTKKSIILVIAGCLILSSFFFYQWATKVQYAALFTNVQADNAGKIVEGLKTMNIPYQLTDAGQTIMVPKDQVYEVRLSLASKGVVAEGGPGFELFDTSNMGATDFERNINYQRALQEELRRSIVQIDAVKQARVHLVIPEKSAFIDNQQKAQASIVLQLKPMVSLQPEQVKAIAELVTGSVQNLSIEDVNIVDTAGHILSDSIKKDGNSSALQLTQLELKRTFEKNLEGRIQQFLESIYGPNKAVAMVTANLDFNQKEADRTIWGTEGVIRSEQLTQNNTTATNSSLPVGDPNRDPTIVSITGPNNANADISSTKNYEINKVDEKEIYAPGRVLSLSTAVAINGDLPPDAVRIKDIVSAAIGFDSNRGDTLNIMSTTFDQTSLDAANAEMATVDAEAKKKAKIDQWMSWGFKGIGIIISLILGLLMMRYLRSRSERPELIIQQPTLVTKVEEQLQQLEQFDRKNTNAGEDEKIKKIFNNQPEVAAQIITNWLEENGSETSG